MGRMSRKYTSHWFKEVASRTGISEEEARRILLNGLRTIEDWLGEGHSVTLIGFGSFSLYIRRAGKFFGKVSPARWKVKFRPGSFMRRALARRR